MVGRKETKSFAMLSNVNGIECFYLALEGTNSMDKPSILESRSPNTWRNSSCCRRDGGYSTGASERGIRHFDCCQSRSTCSFQPLAALERRSRAISSLGFALSSRDSRRSLKVGLPPPKDRGFGRLPPGMLFKP